MARVCLVALQAGVVAFAVLAVAVLAAPFSSWGLPVLPSRMAVGLFIVTAMPFEGPALCGMLPHLAWIPAVSAVAAFAERAPALRPLRWAGVAVNLAGLAYVYRAFPVLASPDKAPLPLVAMCALFLVSALFLIALPRRSRTGSGRMAALFFLAVVWVGCAALLAYGAYRHNAPLSVWAGVAGSVAALGAASYCMGNVAASLGTRRGGNVPALLLPPLALAAVCFFVSPPLAFAVGAGLVIVLAAAI